MTTQPGFRYDVAEWVLAMPVAAQLGFSFEELADGHSRTRLPWRRELSHTPGAFQSRSPTRQHQSPARRVARVADADLAARPPCPA